MEIDFLTKGDLDSFRTILLNDIKELLQHTHPTHHKEWLKANEVRKLMGVSNGKLQGLRIQGILPSSKIGGVHYYRYADIEDLLQRGFALKQVK